MSYLTTYNQSPRISTFFGIFEKNFDQRLNDQTPFEKFNRVYVAFAKLVQKSDQFFLEIDGPEENAIKLINRVKVVNPKAEILISLGGDGSNTSFGGASKNTEFPKNVVSFLSKFGFHGLDVDWEIELDKTLLNNLMTKLFKELHPLGYKLTLDVWPDPNPAYDGPFLKDHLDQVNIMSYGSDINASHCIRQYRKIGFSSEQLVIGIDTENGDEQDTLGPRGSIAQKARYAAYNNLKVMEWRLDNDFTNSNNIPTYEGGNQIYQSMNDKIG